MGLAYAASVLVVGQDADLRAAVGVALEAEGHVVSEVSAVTDALTLLRTSEAGKVVVWDATPAIGGLALLAAVLREPQLARRHSYVLLTTSQRAVLAALGRVLSPLWIAVVEMPFALETLLMPVALASFHLRGVRGLHHESPTSAPGNEVAALSGQLALAHLPHLRLLESGRRTR